MGRKLGFYVPIYCVLPRDPKLAKTAKDLKVKDYDMVRVKIENLWLWTMENRPDGTIPDADAADIAEYSNWKGDAKKWLQVLLDRRWLEKRPDGSFYIHEWDLYCGRLLDTIEYNRICVSARRNPLVQAFSFCESPSLVSKYKAIQELLRQKVQEKDILDSAENQERRTWDFYAHIKSLTPNHKNNGAQVL